MNEIAMVRQRNKLGQTSTQDLTEEVFNQMLRVIGQSTEVDLSFTIDPYNKIYIEWGKSSSEDHVYWQLSTDTQMLMVGVNKSSGLLASIVNPIAPFEYKSDVTFSFSTESSQQGIPIFDVSPFIKENTDIITETTPFSMIVGAHQILIDFQSQFETISCIASEKVTFYLDRKGFITKIICSLTPEEMRRWKSYYL